MKKQMIKILIAGTIMTTQIATMGTTVVNAAEVETNNITIENSVVNGEGKASEEDNTIAHIPDENVREAINMRLRQEKDSPITIGQLRSLENLDFLGFDIEYDFTGIEYCTNLKDLNINVGKAKNLHKISGLTNLESLSISDENFSDVSILSNLKSLEFLSLYYTNVSDISSLSNLIALKSLTIAYSNINDVTPLKNLTKLEELDVSHNNITDMSTISNLSSVKELNLSGNNIKKLGKWSNLEEIAVDTQQMSQIQDINEAMLNGTYVGCMTPYNVVDYYGGIKNPLTLENVTFESQAPMLYSAEYNKETNFIRVKQLEPMPENGYFGVKFYINGKEAGIIISPYNSDGFGEIPKVLDELLKIDILELGMGDGTVGTPVKFTVNSNSQAEIENLINKFKDMNVKFEKLVTGFGDDNETVKYMFSVDNSQQAGMKRAGEEKSYFTLVVNKDNTKAIEMLNEYTGINNGQMPENSAKPEGGENKDETTNGFGNANVVGDNKAENTKLELTTDSNNTIKTKEDTIKTGDNKKVGLAALLGTGSLSLAGIMFRKRR
ncbi:MAG: leucine-rich repeat domain-containing protein [Clostridiaceae bacterium]|nr:leucine-rich repeat domain-containing protein [Clostridiaceae bacterium]